MMRILRMVTTSRLAQCAVIVHLLFVELAVAQMWTDEEVGCPEAIVPSEFDRPVAGRLFFYNYCSDVTSALVVIDLPGLVIADELVTVVGEGMGGLSYMARSWANAVGYAMATTIQWAVVGAVGSGAVRRWRSRKR